MMRENARRWSAEDDRLLSEMAGAGKTNAEIAAALGVTANAVGGRKFKLCLTKPNGRRGQSKQKQAAE